MEIIENNKLLTVEMNKEELIEMIYWIVMKFKNDNYHNQFISNKNDDLGCFFDRWIERFPEYVILNNLLIKKDYSIVKDNFIYGQNTQKNSPDVIGLEDSEHVYPIAQFDNGDWKIVDDAPFVEIKTFKHYQNLITIPESQFDDDKYYVIVISNLKDDYLLNIFDDDFFKDENFKKMEINYKLVKSDENNMLIKPKKLEKPNYIGNFELFGIYKGKNLKKVSIVTQNNPRYLKYIEKREINHRIRLEMNEGLYYHLKKEEDNVPICIKKEQHSNIYITNIGKTFVDVDVEGTVIVDNIKLKNDTYRLNYHQFKRGSSKNEVILSKNTISQALESEHEELINKFDEFIKRYRT